MLHILLLILKWIALILGGIIGLLLLLRLLVLFVPLRYRMRLVSGEEGITGRIQADCCCGPLALPPITGTENRGCV